MHNRAINYLNWSSESERESPVCNGNERMEQIPKLKAEKHGVSLGLFPMTSQLSASCPLHRFGPGQSVLFMDGQGDRYNEWLLLCNISKLFDCVRMEWKLFYPAWWPKQTPHIPQTWMCVSLKLAAVIALLSMRFGVHNS